MSHQIKDVLAKAARLCEQRNVRLTEQRKQVLEILCLSAKPMGAYEVLEKLQKVTPHAKPPTVYRALDFLLEQGLAHKLETLHAYVGCSHPDHPHSSQFLICTDCGGVTELEDSSIANSIGKAAIESGFQAEYGVVEIKGRCSNCSPP